MVEAELGNGEIGQITQAIQNALRSPTTPAFKRLTAPKDEDKAAAAQEVEAEAEDAEENESVEQPPTFPRVRSSRKPPPTPNIVDLDMNQDVSLASFAHGRDAGSQHKKYLIATAWLKEHRGINGVTADHIYTCFRSMDWPTNIPDFYAPLRSLKAKKYFTTNDNGEYEINHIGLDYVRRLGGSNGAA
jgi:hypothetical protein